MNIRKFEKINTVAGLIVFLIALTTYFLTVEPTASYWVSFTALRADVDDVQRSRSN